MDGAFFSKVDSIWESLSNDDKLVHVKLFANVQFKLVFSYSAVYTMCDPVKSSPVPGWNEGLCLIPEHHQGQSSGPEWAPWHPSQVAIRTCTYVVQNNFCCVPRARIYLDGMSPEEFVERCPLAAVYRD